MADAYPLPSGSEFPEPDYSGVRELRHRLDLALAMLEGNGKYLAEHRHFGEPEDEHDYCGLCVAESEVKFVMHTIEKWEMGLLDQAEECAS